MPRDRVASGARGRVAERLNATVLKTVRRANPVSGVRIPPLPPTQPNLRVCRRLPRVRSRIGMLASTAQKGWKGLLRGAAYPIPTPGGAVESAIASHSVAA